MSDKKHIAAIEEFSKKYRRMPSYREILTLTGLRSSASVFKLVKRLIQGGMLEKDRKGKLLPSRKWNETPLLGTIEAGFPSPQEEYRSDTMSLDEYLIPERDRSYLLKVKGDSMKDAGIMEGDLVIAERTPHAQSGDIVIARIDGENTIKYYRNKNGKSYLEAANMAYKPMHPRESLVIEAVVRGIVRKYK